MRKFFGILLVLLMVLQVGAVSAAADSNYDYTVRVYAGNRGTVNGGSVAVYSGRPYGDTTLSVADILSTVQESDSKYYVQGIRYAGQDNDALQTGIVVDRDVDYVVAYGIRGNLVAYTVNYQDAAGATLAPSQTYYGNAGEKPVIAFLYIDGYQPQAYNLTGTLSATEPNVFTFVYTPLVIATPDEEVVDNGVADGAGANGAGGAAGADGALTDVPDENTPLAAPQEIIDLDDDDTPLAGFNGSGSQIREPNSEARFIWSISFLMAAIAAMSATLWFLLRKRKKNEAEG